MEEETKKREWKPFRTGGFYTCFECKMYLDIKEERDELSSSYMDLVNELEEWKGTVRAFEHAMADLEMECRNWQNAAHYLGGLVSGLRGNTDTNPENVVIDAYEKVRDDRI